MSDTQRLSAQGLVGTWTPEEVYRAEQLVRQLEQHPGFEIVSRLLNIEREGAVRWLTNQVPVGQEPPSQASYAYHGGRANGLAGLRAAVALVHNTAEAVRRKIESDDGETK